MAETKIKAALIRFNGAIKSSDGVALSSALNEVEALLSTHRQELHPQLRHFLEGRSYAKALAWLGAADELGARPSSPPGGCGGGHA
ncbi:hypothetical protein ESB00_05940 [Oleiharenicola lentus]|jgi:hypothetical protein|uniref:Uncharacterized protein n=1 Tax=Oleiharenicola lentus TaxID=2508720 RepID=A0A4V1M6H7_9BACT|nr:hypothetical protein [Oleiharenicola lentus]RXK55439.1 hypothetical protein ESB00_05940 [Oleiharenicola lentus]